MGLDMGYFLGLQAIYQVEFSCIVKMGWVWYYLCLKGWPDLAYLDKGLGAHLGYFLGLWAIYIWVEFFALL